MRSAGRRLRALSAAASAVALALLIAACGSDGERSQGSLEELRESGTVRIGVTDGLPTSGPEASAPTGVVPEMIAMVFDELGVPNVEPVPMDFGAMIPSLQSGRIDVAGGGLYVLPERCEAVAFATPALAFYDGFAVETGNPHNIRTYEDVGEAGIQMGSIAGAANIELAEAAGVDPSNIQRYPELISLLDALKAGRIEAAPFDNVTISYMLDKPAYSDLDATEAVAPIVDGEPRPYLAAVAFPKGQEDLATEYSKVQSEMLRDGAFDEVLEKWSFPALSKQTDPPLLEELCSADA